MYDAANIQLPTNQTPPTDVPAIALHDSREILRAYANTPNRYPTEIQSREMRRGYYANISYMDKQVGKVLDELDRLDLRKNTIIVLWSDHGFHLGEKGLWAKTSNFELDARVPLIISTPQYNQSQRTHSLVELLDIYPTLADLCNLQSPPDLAGRSLVSILRNPRSTVKDVALTQHCRPAYPTNGSDPEAIGYSIRTDRYRYTEWRDYRSGAILAHELYDHKRDPNETANVFSKSNQHLRKNLAAALNTVVHSHGNKKGVVPK
jgi:iduronate 2-sulfatase